MPSSSQLEMIDDDTDTVFATTEEVLLQAASEGLQLVRARTQTGFKGVRRNSGNIRKPFRAKASRKSAKHGYLGDLATAAEAALCYTRHHTMLASAAANAASGAAGMLQVAISHSLL
jgi:hypothetical protein